MNLAMHIVTAVNDDAVLCGNLMRSPMVANGSVPVITMRGYRTAGCAYNEGAQRASSSCVIFAHQDVYLPAGWDSKLAAAIQSLDQADSAWGVLGVWGIRHDGTHAGRVWCSGGNREYRAPLPEGVCEIASIDEVVIVLNAATGLKFDADLPGFHLYATDIILDAKRRGLNSYVFDGPVVHNSRANPQVFDRWYFKAYRYMQRKWTAQLPIPTCTVPITRWGSPLYRAWIRRELGRWRGSIHAVQRHARPEELAVQLGYEGSTMLSTGRMDELD